MKLSLIATILNEEESIDQLLKSLEKQTLLPEEIIITDGGSIDHTVEILHSFITVFKRLDVTMKVIVEKGNRSVGRNAAIKQASGDVILCSDAGCTLDREWVKNIVKPFSNSKVDIVAGYYEGKAKTVFEKCLIPYVLVMEDKVNPDSFLPASRSMAFRKIVWEKVGGFPENMSHNEDYVFAHRLKKIGARIAFQKDAIVYWLPRKTFSESFTMFYRFAYGDAEAGIFRPKIILLFARYLTCIVILLAAFYSRSYLILHILYPLFVLYLMWAVWKNYKYVKDWRAILYLPLLQLIADGAVILGTSIGFISKLGRV